MSERIIEKEESFREGWRAMKQFFPQFALLGLATAFVSALIDAIAAPSSPGELFGRGLLRVVLQLIQVGLGMVWVRFALDADHLQKPEPQEVRPLLGMYFDYLIASVLYGLMVAVGLVLLIAPGLIWAARYGFFPFFLIDQKVDTLTALRRSAAATKGITGQVMVFGLLCCGINLLGALAFGFGLLATVPTTAVAAAHVYRRIRDRAGTLVTTAPPTFATRTP